MYSTDELGGLELIRATHCTKYKAEIRARFPEEYVYDGVSTVIGI